MLDDLIAAGDGLLTGRHPLATPTEITGGVLHYVGKRGYRGLREAGVLIRPRVESRRETFLRLFLVRCRFPEPVTPHFAIYTHLFGGQSVNKQMRTIRRR